MKSLLETIQEVEPDEEKAMTLHALIQARYFLLERDGVAGDQLPLLIQVRFGKERYALSVGGAPEREE